MPLAESRSATAFVRDVGLSDATRKKGLRNLDELGVLIPNDDQPRDDLGERGQRLRPRKVYTISPDWAPDLTRSSPRDQALRS